MAHISEFEVTGLVGRKAPLKKALNRDVNVFFGVNGSGKTSLLKILNGAMANERRSLLNVAFSSASVSVYSETHKREFRGTFDKSTQPQLPFDLEAFETNLVYLHEVPHRRVVGRQDIVWSWKPSYDGAFAHRYLPTSRLYGEAASWRREARDRITEEELENVLAEFLDRLWASYSAIVLGAAKRVQDEGLNSILRSVLSRKPARVGIELNPDDAYRSAVSFLGGNTAKVLGSPEEFRKRFTSDVHMQVVIAKITEIDSQVKKLTVPRTRLQQLITDMFSGPKTVSFTDSAIDVVADKHKIRLASLSSGEKQLLRILLETLSAGESTIIIDEPEISMHVDWQKRLVAAMRQLNPECQIILATHSPEIMADLADDRIFRL